MKPNLRVLLNLLLPGIISGGVIGSFMYLGTVFDGTHRTLVELVEAPIGILFVIAYASAFTLLPAAASTATLEWLYRRKGLVPSSARAVVISAAMGLFSGTALIVCTTPPELWRHAQNLPALALYATIGTVTGTLPAKISIFGEGGN